MLMSCCISAYKLVAATGIMSFYFSCKKHDALFMTSGKPVITCQMNPHLKLTTCNAEMCERQLNRHTVSYTGIEETAQCLCELIILQLHYLLSVACHPALLLLRLHQPNTSVLIIHSARVQHSSQVENLLWSFHSYIADSEIIYHFSRTSWSYIKTQSYKQHRTEG